LAKPKIRYATADAPNAISSAGRRPKRSGESSPVRCTEQLGHGERRRDDAGEEADTEMRPCQVDARSVQLLHIEGNQRDDHEQPHHVDEGGGHQDEQLRCGIFRTSRTSTKRSPAPMIQAVPRALIGESSERPMSRVFMSSVAHSAEG
jgi:hypothetical protein